MLLCRIAAAIWLRPSAKAGLAVGDGKVEFGASVKAGWVGLGRMLKEWRKLPQTFVFLAAWFLLSDGQCCSQLSSLKVSTHLIRLLPWQASPP